MLNSIKMKAQCANICGNQIKLCLESNFLALNAYIIKEKGLGSISSFNSKKLGKKTS